MSFTIIEPAPARLNRSELAVPGSRPELFEKAAKSAVDVLFLDLEDAVAPDDKEQARRNIVKALNEIDFGKKTVAVRINGLDTHYMYRDVVDVVEQAGHRLDTVLIPKVGVPADVYLVDALLSQIEAARGIDHRIGIDVLIETALGMANVETIAQSSRRLEAMHFGVADYAASNRARTVSIGWAQDAATAGAVARLAQWFTGETPRALRLRLEPGMGVICNNVLHARSAFSDDQSRPRLLFRARYYDRIRA